MCVLLFFCSSLPCSCLHWIGWCNGFSIRPWCARGEEYARSLVVIEAAVASVVCGSRPMARGVVAVCVLCSLLFCFYFRFNFFLYQYTSSLRILARETDGIVFCLFFYFVQLCPETYRYRLGTVHTCPDRVVLFLFCLPQPSGCVEWFVGVLYGEPKTEKFFFAYTYSQLSSSSYWFVNTLVQVHASRDV